MNKKELKKLAILGIASGVFFSAAQADAAGYRSGNQQYFAGRNGCGGGNSCGGHGGNNGNGSDENGSDENDSDKKNENESAYFDANGELNEKGLLSQLSPESRQVYQSLDASEKQLVLRMAKQFQDKNNALKQAQKQKETNNEKEQVEKPRRSILRHSLF